MTRVSLTSMEWPMTRGREGCGQSSRRRRTPSWRRGGRAVSPCLRDFPRACLVSSVSLTDSERPNRWFAARSPSLSSRRSRSVGRQVLPASGVHVSLQPRASAFSSLPPGSSIGDHFSHSVSCRRFLDCHITPDDSRKSPDPAGSKDNEAENEEGNSRKNLRNPDRHEYISLDRKFESRESAGFRGVTRVRGTSVQARSDLMEEV